MFKDIRSRILLLSAVAMFPAIILLFVLTVSDNKSKSHAQITNLQSITSFFSQENSQIIENAKHLLIALSVAPQVKSGGNECFSYLKTLLSQYQRYNNFGVADLKGNVYCSSIPTQETINIANTLFFTNTVKTHNFSIGGYRVSQATSAPVLSFGYPLNNSKGQIIGVIYSSIDLDWLSNLTNDLSEDPSITTLIVDKEGSVLARNPGSDKWVGQKLPAGPLLSGISTSTQGVVEDIGLDGIKRTYAYEKIGNYEPSFYIVNGETKKAIFAETKKNFTGRIAVTLGFITISFYIAWKVGSHLIVRQVEALETVDKLKDDFISLVSHQIRTPITSIRWFSEYLLGIKDKPLPTKQRGIVRNIKDAAVSLANLVGTLLNISRFESGKTILQADLTDPKLLIKDVLQEVRKNYPKSNIALHIPDRNLIIKADAKLIKQVMLILTENAIKYSISNSRINVYLSEKRGKIVFTIKDKGIGINPSDKDKIFEKFSRGKNAISFSPNGAGLGLYLAKLIVKTHHGKIWFTSTKGKGSIFNFSLPKND